MRSNAARSKESRAGRTPVSVASGDDLVDIHRRYFETREPRLRNDLVVAHAGLAYELAGRFAHRGVPADDLAQIALLGLLLAVERYDPRTEVPFAGFAYPTIQGELKRYFRDKVWSVRVPRRVQETYLAAKEIAETLTQELERTPSHAEIAKLIGVDQALLDEAIDAGSNFHALSIDVEFAASHPENRAALGGVDHDLAAVDNRRQLLALSKGLSSTSLRAVDLYFRMGWTQTEVASDLGVTQMRVSRLLTKAIYHMRGQARKADSREHRGHGNPARSRRSSSPHAPLAR